MKAVWKKWGLRFTAGALLLSLLTVCPHGAAAEAGTGGNAADISFQCGASIEAQEAMCAALLRRKQNEVTGISPRVQFQNLHPMPSVGKVRLLVLPVMFADSTPLTDSWEGDRALYQNVLFGADDGGATKDQSVQAFYSRQSYGRLELEGDILPFYFAKGPKADYWVDNGNLWHALQKEALTSYDIDYSSYDADGDGYVDLLCFIEGNGINQNGENASYNVAGSEWQGFRYDYGEARIGQALNVYAKWMEIDASVFSHEVAHAMGLTDHYRPEDSGWCFLPPSHEDLMGQGNNIYINAFYKYLLDWIEPVVITNESPIGMLELSAVEQREPALSQEPKALLYIPDPKKLPFTEFFIAEYRNALDSATGPEGSLGQRPGVTLWHCDAKVTGSAANDFEDRTTFLQSVRPTGGESNRDFTSADFFVPQGEPWSEYSVSSVVSPDTQPTNSNFKNNFPTKFYMEVLDQDNDRAVLRVGAVGVGQVQQPFSITPVGEKTYGDGPFQLSTVGGSGAGEVSYEIVTGGDVLTLSPDGQATIQKVGRSRLKATKAGDDVYRDPVSNWLSISVSPRDIQKANVYLPTVVYTGEQCRPVPNVSDGKNSITSDDYDVRYGENIGPGIGTVTLTGKGNYTGSLEKTFTIAAAETIETVEDFRRFAEKVNGGDSTYINGHFLLSADIDLTESEDLFIPIGNNWSNAFQGVFDGKGHRITGVAIRGGTDSSGDHQGIFGFVRENGVIQNLAVEGTVAGRVRVGSIAGNNMGTIRNCYSCCNVSGEVYVGGVAGYNDGTIENCYNTGEITGSYSGIGGISGINFNKIASCYSIGTIQGQRSEISGIVGMNEDAATVEGCYYLSGTGAGGIAGRDIPGAAEEKTAAEFQVEDSFAGWDFAKVWTMTGERPILQAVPEKGVHFHEYYPDWGFTETIHWHECWCGVRKDESPHIPQIDPMEEPNCTTGGKKEGSHCLCGYTIIPQIDLPPLGHSYSEGWSKDEGNHWHECSRCQDKGDINSHTEDDGTVVRQPTLEDTGLKAYACSVCNYEMRTETLPRLEPSHEHTFSSEWKSDSISHWHECECGAREDESDHVSQIDPAEEPDCTSAGKTEGSHCSVCGHIITPQVDRDPVGHSYLKEWSKDEADHWHECYRCQDKRDISSHVEDDGTVVQQPTPEDTGLKVYACSICNYEMRIEALPRLEPSHEHTFSSEWKSDSISHWHECECGAREDEEVHVPQDDPTIESTCTTHGKTEGSHCAICKYTIKAQAETPLKSHSYSKVWASDATHHWHKCDNCAEIDGRSEHRWNDGVVTTVPTSSTAGIKTYTCTVCKRNRTDTVPASGGNSSTSGGGYISNPVEYIVTLPQRAEGGDVKTSQTKAEKGTEIVLSVEIDDGYELGEIEVWGKNGKKLELRGGGGKYIFTMPTANVNVTVSFYKKQPEEAVPPIEKDIPAEGKDTGLKKLLFVDVSEKSWYYDAIAEVNRKGIMIGLTENQFAPEIPVSRGMVVTMLWRIDGETIVHMESEFDDIPEKKYYTMAVAWATKAGMVKGYGDGTFRPDEGITREQLITILYRYAEQKGYNMTQKDDFSRFFDANQISSYAVDAMGWAMARDILNGTDWGGIDPLGITSRAQAAAIINRYVEMLTQN